MSDVKSFTIGEDVPLGGELAALGGGMTAPISLGGTPNALLQPSQASSSRVVGDAVAAAQRPDWLPAKFTSPADMAKAYTELEAKLGGGASKPETPAEAKTAETPTQTPAATPKFAGLEAEIATGALKPETLKSLEDAGLPRALIEGALQSQQFAAQALVGMVHEQFGGAEGWKDAQTRAASALSPAEQQFVNSLLGSRDYAKTAEGVRFLKGKLGGLQSPGYGRADTPKDDGFKSADEMFAAQRDPRYATDSLYTREFERKAEIMFKNGRFK